MVAGPSSSAEAEAAPAVVAAAVVVGGGGGAAWRSDGGSSRRRRRARARALHTRAGRRALPDARRQVFADRQEEGALPYAPAVTELRFRNGVTLREPLALALLCLEHDYGYRTYDSQTIRTDAEWRREDAQIANRAGARMSSREIDALMGRSTSIEDALQRIPGDLSLAASSEEIPWDALHDLYAAFGGIPGIGLAKATKSLHKKRPHLIPMLDSVVAGYLRSVDRIRRRRFRGRSARADSKLQGRSRFEQRHAGFRPARLERAGLHAQPVPDPRSLHLDVTPVTRLRAGQPMSRSA